MAHVYDSLYDGIGVPWLSGCVPSWDAARLFLMNIQFIIALAVGLCACLYIIIRIIANLKKSDADAKCGGCSIKKDSLQSDR